MLEKENYAVHGHFSAATFETYSEAMKEVETETKLHPESQFTVFKVISRHTLRITGSKMENIQIVARAK